MGIFDIDLAKVRQGIADGSHTATIQKVEYQVKTGASWNNEGTTNVLREEFTNSDPDLSRMHLTLNVPGQGNIWHDLYFSDKSLGFVKSFYKALGCGLSEDITGRTVGITVATIEDPKYGEQTRISKVFKA